MRDLSGRPSLISADLEDGVGCDLLFSQAYSAHRPALLRFLKARVPESEEAADMAQEAYASLLRYRSNQTPASLRALLFSIARNLVLMRARSLRVRVATRHMPLEVAEAHGITEGGARSLDEQVAAGQRLDRLMAAIEELPVRCRHVFLLSRFEGLSNPQIAARQGISVKTVEKHITSALAHCRRRLEEPS